MNQNPNREPSSKPNAILELFQDKKLILGEVHVQQGLAGSPPCGPNCPARLKTITCPYFTPTTPCLVGCRVKQILDDGQPGNHREINIFVTSQAGSFLIGEENLINLNNPRHTYLRIVSNKHGQEISVTESSNMTLFDLEPGLKIASGKLPEEGENAVLEMSMEKKDA